MSLRGKEEVSYIAFRGKGKLFTTNQEKRQNQGR